MSKNGAGLDEGLGDDRLALNFGVVRLVLDPLSFGVRFHLQLEHVVLLDLVASEVRQRRVLYDNAGRHVLKNVVVADQCLRIFLRKDAAGVIIYDQVMLNNTFRINQDDAVVIVIDGILLNDELLLALDDEDALTLAVFDHVVLYFGFSRVLASHGDVCLNIGVDFVPDNFCPAAFNNKDTLVVVVSDDV